MIMHHALPPASRLLSLRYSGLLGGLMLCMILLSAPAMAAQQISGFVEMVTLYPGKLQLKAKIDTGAFNSSLHCTTCDQTFQKDGKEWVRFSVTNWRGETIELVREVIGRSKITRHFGEEQERPVILLPVCLGGVLKEKKVNLVDRSGFDYPMLIGRNFLKGDFLVDAAEKYLLHADCPETAQHN